MITYPAPNAAFKLDRPVLVEGRVWLGEGAILQVELSFDERGLCHRAGARPG